MRAQLRAAIALMFILLPVSQLFAEDDSGTYVTIGLSQYKEGKFTLAAWGNGYDMTATLLRDGREYEVNAFVEPTSSGLYEGSGYITVRYRRGFCRHRFGTKIYVTSSGMYLRDNTPGYIPYSPNGACQAAGPYVWQNHEAPYLKQ